MELNRFTTAFFCSYLQATPKHSNNAKIFTFCIVFILSTKNYYITNTAIYRGTMGYLVFFGCLFIAFGPVIGTYSLVLSKSPQLVIISIGRYK
jgi:hypothetical protein